MQSYVSIRRLMLSRIQGEARSAKLVSLAWVLTMLATACSAVVDTDKAKLGPSPVPCEPGQTAACPCRDGSTSTQKCNAMARFDTCVCGATAGRSGNGGAGNGGAGARGTNTSGFGSASAGSRAR